MYYITLSIVTLLFFLIPHSVKSTGKKYSYPIVDTNQTGCYNNYREIRCPGKGSIYYGQDAQIKGNKAHYKNNKNGTISDVVTGLMWTMDPGEKMTLDEARAKIKRYRFAGYSDWRIPTIKELYSLIQFSGIDIHPQSQRIDSSIKPFIDNRFFKFRYGDVNNNERLIDSQFLSSTIYVSYTMHRHKTVFGVNFADGRIKGYGLYSPRERSYKKFFVLFVRGNKQYGKNRYRDNKNGTISDLATGLMWMQQDSGHLKANKNKYGVLNWSQALVWSKNLKYAGYSDWRLPNAKELQSIVDYSRSPKTSNSASINPLFKVSRVTIEDGTKDYGFYWTSTTHKSERGYDHAVYVAFGRSMGWMRPPYGGEYKLLDVHGAGSQRSDPKMGDAHGFPRGRGPQGDVVRIYNMIRCVRNIR